MSISSSIIATGSYLPRKILLNSDLEKIIDTTDSWIVERTGIKSRHIAAEGELTSDLGAKALNNALSKAGIDAASLDGVIVATTTPDQIFPSTAAIIQRKANLKPGFALDMNAVCSGFIYALCVADSLIKTSVVKRIAVIGAETMSRIIDWQDRNTCVLFGDGAGAVILEAVNEKKTWEACLSCDGTLNDILHVPGGVSSGYANEKLQMQGREVFRHGVDSMIASSLQVLEQAHMSVDQVDIMIPHQANIRMLEMVASRLAMPIDKVAITLDTQGNTSAATIPLAMDMMLNAGRMQRGMHVMLSAAGAGFSWGSILFNY